MSSGWTVRACGRDASRAPSGAEFIQADLHDSAIARQLVDGVDTVIHLAARVHVMRDSAKDPLDEFRRANVAVTDRLGAAARVAGARQFIYASSIKALGESTSQMPFSENSPYDPQDPYGVSKMEAEQALLAQSGEFFQPTIFRLPLTYGPGVGGNFARLLRLVRSGIPLPFGSISNARSMLYVGNLVSAFIRSIDIATHRSHVYMLSDGEDLSTPGLIKAIAKAMNVPARVFSFPGSLLQLLGSLGGFSGELRRLTDSLAVDSSRIRSDLQWIAPYSVTDALRNTVSQESIS
jgi:nucleoside-diphosphate-sugar epimerase